MAMLAHLWIPILAAAVAVFIVSSILHMALPAWHRSDYGKVPQEDAFMAAVRLIEIPPGDYMVPDCTDPAQMKSPEMAEKLRRGPVMVFTMMPPGPMSAAMGKSLILWFVYLVIISSAAACLTAHALTGGVVATRMVGFAGAASFLGYAPALWQMSIWYRRSWLTTFKGTIDGAIYAAVTAATFVWLWPHGR